MMTAADRESLFKGFLAALQKRSAPAAARLCLADIAARENPTTVPYERPLILDMPRPQPLSINISGK